MMKSMDILLKDFAKVSEAAFEVRDGKRKAREKRNFDALIEYSVALADLAFFDKDGLAWYGGREGFMPEVPIGKPDDYLGIRDDYSSLKAFMGKTLDRGKVRAGGGTHGDTSRETNCADYISWMYSHSEYQPFRRNVEQAVGELLEEGFGKEYATFDIAPELKKEERIFREIYGSADKWLGSMFDRDNLDTSLWRLGLETNVLDEDKDFKSRFEKEVRKTERPITLKEVHELYGGSKEELTKSFRKGRFRDEMKPHYKELPKEFKREIRKWYTLKQATEKAARNFSPQFNRLIGLLDVVSHIGKHDEKFAEIYGILKQKAEDKFMIDAPMLIHHYSGSDIYRSILVALGSVQQGKELEQFWLDGIKGDPDYERVIASVHGLLTMHKAKTQRRKLIPRVLEGLHGRGYDVDKTYQEHKDFFYTNENFLDDITRHTTSLCYSSHTYHRLDKEAGTLDFLQKKEIGEGKYSFRFARYTAGGRETLSAAFDVSEDSVQGDTGLEKTVRAYLDENGYELPKDVWVTSLEGRRITGKRTKIAVPEGKDMEGLYEGIIGLNHTHFPFVYDEASGNLLLAEPAASVAVIFGIRDGWEKRRMGLDKLKEPIPYSGFQTISDFGQTVNNLAADKKKKGYIGDSLYGLSGRLSGDISAYLAAIVRGRLVRHSDGLVK